MSRELAMDVGCLVRTLLVRYLQLDGRLQDCQEWDKVLNNLRSRLMLWNTHYLLMGGKVVLIKSFARCQLFRYCLGSFQRELS